MELVQAVYHGVLQLYNPEVAILSFLCLLAPFTAAGDIIIDSSLLFGRIRFHRP